ncbi:hypothetical protein BKA70DRAFT_1259694 [Coprinopsis sp. MPI-PUGE-AT-0042]|nr:hypothetical protein BKA70DRAFT_1259694 [Coprinopsis sp. MPI-PUGE-AT-0042]
MAKGSPDALVKSPFDNIPIEVLEQIFDRVVPPAWLFHRPGVELPNPNSLDMCALRQQKGLISVCKAWQAVGLRYLYEDVFIRRPAQMLMLYETLAQKPSLGLLIRRLHLCCITHPETDAKLSTAVYHALERYCHNIVAVDIAMVASDRVPPVDIPIAYSYRFPVPLRRLNVIHYGENLGKSPWYHLTFDNFLASHASTLTHLSITLESFQEHCIMQRSLDFPLLRSLSTSIEDGATEQFPHLEKWILPSLIEFTVTYTEWSNLAMRNTIAVKSFLQKHGKRLRYLHLKPEATGPPSSFDRRDRFDVQALVDLCPSLEHLALQPWLRIPPVHRNIRWIDVWFFDGMESDFHGYPLDTMSLAEFQSSGLPNLLSIRRLAMSLRYIQDLPLKITHDSFDLEFGRLCVRSTDGVVRQAEEPWSEDEGGEDALDLRYEPVEIHESSDEEMENERKACEDVDEGDREKSAETEGEEEDDPNLSDTSSADSDWTDRLSLELDDPVDSDAEETTPVDILDLGPGYEGWIHFQGRQSPIRTHAPLA